MISSADAIAPAPTDANFLLYSSFDGTVQSMAGVNESSRKLVNQPDNSSASLKSEIYLSPSRKLIAVTLDPTGDNEGDSMTYIADIAGKQLTQAYIGRFRSWAPDSSKILLYVSPMERPWIREIYALSVAGNYYNFGLPEGTIDASISPLNNDILYSITLHGTDDSELRVRHLQGSDQVLVGGNGNILGRPEWSPSGDRIVFLKSDLHIMPGQQTVWITNGNGGVPREISNIDWGYPPAWAPDGTKVAFSYGGNIREYDLSNGSLRNVTNYINGVATHPSYSADGKTIVFSGPEGQIWSSQANNLLELTHLGTVNDYPILP